MYDLPPLGSQFDDQPREPETPEAQQQRLARQHEALRGVVGILAKLTPLERYGVCRAAEMFAYEPDDLPGIVMASPFRRPPMRP